MLQLVDSLNDNHKLPLPVSFTQSAKIAQQGIDAVNPIILFEVRFLFEPGNAGRKDFGEKVSLSQAFSTSDQSMLYIRLF